jgi:chemotaxis protein methyltransferase CheR
MTAVQISPSPTFVSSLFLQPDPMTDVQFHKVSTYIEHKVGIKMPETKKTMMQARLTSRLKALDMHSYKEYLSYVFSNDTDADEELVSMIDVLTTNLTHFFREKEHFNVMMRTVLPTLASQNVTIPKIWSAGCSTGEEAYTLSMVMQEFLRLHHNAFIDYEIRATDISTRALEKAALAIYPMESVEEISEGLKRRYFLKSRQESKASVRVNKQTRDKVQFTRLNFMDDSYGPRCSQDIIFCRNVLIYFDKQTQREVLSKLASCLKPQGFLFLGHSETIFGMNLPLESIAPTVFRKTAS